MWIGLLRSGGPSEKALEGDVHVQHGLIYLAPEHADVDDVIAARGGQANGLCGAAQPGILVMFTGLHTGDVPLKVELHPHDPPIEGGWEDVVEVPLIVQHEKYALLFSESGVDLDGDLPPGSYRARWSARGMDEANDRTRGADEPEIDKYLLQLWPAPAAPDVVIRQGSDAAAYWHSVAAETPPPPPAPTAEELAERAIADERQRQAEWAAWEVEQEVEAWGGKAPTEELRAIGGRTAQLAARDRRLVDALAALPADRQRHLAVWAARRACERAGIANRDWIQAALDTVAQGMPLPPPWGDWDAVWERLSPSTTEDEPETLLEVTSGGPHLQPPRVPPEAAAIDAVHEAAAARPAQAVMGAVDALANGYDDPVHALIEARHQLNDATPLG